MVAVSVIQLFGLVMDTVMVPINNGAQTYCAITMAETVLLAITRGWLYEPEPATTMRPRFMPTGHAFSLSLGDCDELERWDAQTRRRATRQPQTGRAHI